MTSERILILVLIAALGIQFFLLKTKEKELENVKAELMIAQTNISELNGKISIQNEAISKINNEKNKTEQELKLAYDKIKKLNKESQNLREKLLKSPLATNCEEAKKEIRLMNNEIIKKWRLQ